jgi:hypothetical protein
LRLPSRCGRTLLRPRPLNAPRRRDPRCSPPSGETLGRGQRLPTSMRTRGARGLRRDRPPAAPANGKAAFPNSLSIVLLGGGRDPPGGWGGHVSGGHGVPSVRIRGGVSGTRVLADTEGPDPGAHCWVVASGVSARGERGRASAQRPPTRRAKQSHAVREQELINPLARRSVSLVNGTPWVVYCESV